MSVVAKSPLTGAVGMASTGGFFPAELKFAGYDVVIVEGEAAAPTYVVINGDQVQFRDATALWGTYTSDCQQMLKDDLKDQGYRIACIGPAGEHMSRMACIVNERRAAGRKGLGAVMGQKKLKAIVVRGHQDVGVADPEAFAAARSFMREQIREPWTLPDAKIGSPAAFEVTSELGSYPPRTGRPRASCSRRATGCGGRQGSDRGRNPCQGCPVGCSKLKLARNAPYKGILAEGPEFETLYALGTQSVSTNWMPSSLPTDSVTSLVWTPCLLA